MIDSAIARNDYTGNGSASSFNYDFKIFDRTHIKVIVRDLDGQESVLDIDEDYSVAGVLDANGGSIALVANGAAYLVVGTNELKNGFALSVLRDVPLLQETDIRNQRDFYPEVHEDLFDRMVMVEQQLQDQLDRSMKNKDTEDSLDMTLPSVAARAGNFLAFDSDGKPTIASGVRDVGNLIVTPYILTLLDDVNAAAARATLGFAGAGGTVGPTNIDDNAVITRTILDQNVTTAKLADQALTIAKMKETFFNDLTLVTPQFADMIPLADASDAFKKKKATLASIRNAVVGSISSLPYTVTNEDETIYITASAAGTLTLPKIGDNPGKRFKFVHNAPIAFSVVENKFSIALDPQDVIANHTIIESGALGPFKLCTLGEVLEIEDPGVGGTKWTIINHKAKTTFRSLGTPLVSATAAFVFSWTGNKSIVQGDVYIDNSSGFLYTVTTTANTTSGTFSGNCGPIFLPGTTGTLTLVTGTGLASIVWTSRTVTGQPAFGTGTVFDLSYLRDGELGRFRWRVNQTATGSGLNGSGDYILYLPVLFAIKSTVIPWNQQPGTFIPPLNGAAGTCHQAKLMGRGTANWSTAYNAGSGCHGYAYSTTSLRVAMWYWNAGQAGTNLGSGAMPMGSATLTWDFEIEIPIEDWQP